MPPHQTDSAAVQKQLLIETRISNEGKSLVAAYLLWWFFGLFGGHRFYLARSGSAIAMLLISLTVAGLMITAVWALVDAFLIPGMVREENDKLRQRLAYQLG